MGMPKGDAGGAGCSVAARALEVEVHRVVEVHLFGDGHLAQPERRAWWPCNKPDAAVGGGGGGRRGRGNVRRRRGGG